MIAQQNCGFRSQMHYVLLPVPKEGMPGSRAGMGGCDGQSLSAGAGKRSHEVGSPVLLLGKPHRRSPLRLWVSWDHGDGDMGTLQEVVKQRSGFSFPHRCALATPTPPQLLPEHLCRFTASVSPVYPSSASIDVKGSHGQLGYAQLCFSPCG